MSKYTSPGGGGGGSGNLKVTSVDDSSTQTTSVDPLQLEFIGEAAGVASTISLNGDAAQVSLSLSHRIVKVTTNTTLGSGYSGAPVYWTAGTLTLPNGNATGMAEGVHYTIINDTGAAGTVGLGTGSIATGLPSATISDHLSKTFVCVAISSGVATWAVIG